jgi:hypothetical protein
MLLYVCRSRSYNSQKWFKNEKDNIQMYTLSPYKIAKTKIVETVF